MRDMLLLLLTDGVMVVDRVNLKGLAYSNLPRRLKQQANNVELEGWLNAARLMRNAADVLQDLHDHGIIELDLEDAKV